MPTDLPRKKRRHTHQVQADVAQKPSATSRLLNTFMIGTALILFAIVLLQEKRYADGEPGTVADAFIQKAYATINDTGAQGDAEPASN